MMCIYLNTSWSASSQKFASLEIKMWHRNFESESQNLQVEEPPKN